MPHKLKILTGHGDKHKEVAVDVTTTIAQE